MGQVGVFTRADIRVIPWKAVRNTKAEAFGKTTEERW